MLSVVRLLSFSVLAVSLTFQSKALAATQTVFGPKTYSPGLLKPTDVTEQFNATAIAGTIRVVNGDGKEIVIPVCSGNTLKKLLCETSNLLTKAQLLLTRPTSFSIELNNQVVVSQSNLSLLKGSIELPIALVAANKVRVRVAGSFLAKIKVEISAPVGTVNKLPIASMQLSHGQGFAPLTITANGLASSDPDGTIVDFAWDFGDGSTSSGAVVSHIFTNPGTYSVRLTVKDNNGATNTQTKQVLALQNQIPSADLRLTSSGSGLAPLVVIFDGSRSKDPENGSLRYFWNFGDGSAQIEGRPNETHEFVNAGSYTVVLIVRDENGGQAQASVAVQVNAPVLPPAPETIAPPIADIAYPTFEDKISFLYKGENPIQTGVNEAAIDPKRLSVIRGKVFDAEGLPLAGVTVKLLNEKDFGQTISRVDGQFDLAFNSGEFVTVEYSRNGYVLSQRKLSVKGQDYFVAPDVKLVQLDPKVTTISLGSTEAQVAQGTRQIDSSGERTGTVIFPSQTQATIVMADGSTKVVPDLKIRLTEFTVGDAGPQKMPASLPANSAYTYAIEVSADEALALGGRTIKFNKPISFYVDNFLSLPVGTAVPVGSYDIDKGLWVPEADGLVVKLLSRNSNGVAQVDLGANRAATAVELAALGFDEEELKKLAITYADNKSLWRVTSNHFSAKDLNFQKYPNYEIENSSDIEPVDLEEKVPEGKCKGCIINVESAVMQEILDLPGVDFKLVYSTDRVPGKKTGGGISGLVSGAAVPASLKNIEVTVDVAGKTQTLIYPAAPNMKFNYQWDGYDAYGRTPAETVTAKVKVKYLFDETYKVTPFKPGSTSFGSVGAAGGQATAGRAVTSFDKEFFVPIKASQKIDSPAAKKVANGWFVSSHHSYDVRQNALFLGSGKNLFLSSLPYVYKKIAGGGAPGFSGDGALSRFAKLNSPTGAVTAADGSIFIADKGNNRIRKIDPNGVISSVAGNGMQGFAGDGGPAEDSVLNKPHSVKVNRDGSYYIVDTGNHCIRLVDENGTISTFAGVCGQSGFTVGIKNQALLNTPKDIAFNGDGSIFISDTGNHSIRRINPSGVLETLSGTGVAGDAVDAVDAVVAQYREPRISDVDVSGNIFIADKGNNLIRRVAPGGAVKTIVGPLVANEPNFFLPALRYNLNSPNFVAVAPSGEIYFTDSGLKTLSFLDLNGWVNPLIGYRIGNDPYDENYATGTTARIVDVQGIFFNTDGTKLITDAGSNSVATFGPVKPELKNGNYVIPSEDGSEVFIFDAIGKHLRTLYGKTGSVKYNFEYDSENYLVAVTDSFSNRTALSRSGDQLNQIVGPYGHVTTFGVDPGGYLNRMVTPAGDITEITYYPGGLINYFKKPKGNTSGYSYNERGELESEGNPLGGWQKIFKKDIFTTRYTTGEGKGITIEQQTDEDGYEKYTDPDTGRQRYETVYAGSNSNSASDGSYDESTIQYDPRSQGITTFVGYQRVQSSLVEDVQKLTRNYQFPTGNYFDYILTENLLRDGDKVTVRNYVSSSRTETTTTPEGNISRVVLDEYERPVLRQTGTLAPLEFSYNSNGQLGLMRQGDRETSYVYDAKGRLETLVDAMGRQFKFGYDSGDRIVSKVLPDGSVSSFAYDANSNNSAVKPPSGGWHELVHGVLDLLTMYKTPLGLQTTYTYASDREIRSELRPDGVVLNHSYERSSRKYAGTEKSDRSQFVRLNYGAFDGRVFSNTSSDNVVMTYSYDAFLTTEVKYTGAVVGSVENVYSAMRANNAFQASSQIVNGSSMTMDYDKDRNLLSVGTLVASRNSNGQISEIQMQGISEKLAYDSFGVVVERKIFNSGSEIYVEKYRRDKLSRIFNKEVSFSGSTSLTSFEYDLLGRLSQVRSGGVLQHSYSYDENGNRLGPGSQYDIDDKLLGLGDFKYQYTLNGELQSRTNIVTNEVTQYSYDIFGNLKKVVLPNSSIVTYLVNGKHRRVAKLVNGIFVKKFIYNSDDQLVGEMDAAGGLKSHFIYLSQGHSPDGMRSNGVDYYFVKDQLGSIKLVVNASSGAIAQMIDYDEFGVVKTDTNPGFQPFGFVGGLYDHETKLVRFGARDYDADIGRWTSKDPLMFNSGDTNLYNYAFSDPVNFVDPSGHIGIPGFILGGVLGGVGGAIAASILPGATPDKIMAAAATNAVTGAVMGSGAGVAAIIATNLVAQMTFTGGINFGEAFLAGLMGAYGNAASSQLARDFGATGQGVPAALDLATGLSVLPFEIGLGFGQSYNGSTNQCR